MTKMRWKRFITLSFALYVFFFCVGCGKKNSMEYAVEKTQIAEAEGIYNLVAYDGERIYLNAYQLENGTLTTPEIYSMDRDFQNIQKISVPLDKGVYIEQMLVLPDGNIILKTIEQKNSDTRDGMLWKLGAGGEAEFVTPLSEITGTEDAEHQKVLVAGSEVLVVTQREIFLLNGQLQVSTVFEAEQEIEDSGVTKEEKIVCVYPEKYDRPEQKIQMQELNLKTQKWETPYYISFSRGDSDFAIMDGKSCDYYLRNNEGVWGFNREKEQAESLFIFTKLGMSGSEGEGMISLPEDVFLNVVFEADGESAELAIYRKMPKQENSKKKTLILGAIYLDDTVREAVYQFNKQNTKYQIEIKEYSKIQNGTDTADMINRLNADIVSRNGPDIIDLSMIPLDAYIEKEMLEDLTPYLDGDKGISAEVLIPSIREDLSRDGRMYSVVSEFSFYNLVGRTSEVGKESGWTIQELYDLWNARKDSGFLFPADRTTSCWFASMGFKKDDTLLKENYRMVLEMSAKSPKTWDGDITEACKEGKVLLYWAGRWPPLMIQEYRCLFDGDITLKGFPGNEGSGAFFDYICQLGISALSAEKEGAWEFVRMFLTKEYQSDGDNVVFLPTRQDCLEERLSELMKKDGEQRNDLFGVGAVFSINGLEGQYEPLSEEDAELIRTLVAETRCSYRLDTTLLGIIEEEAERYFAGEGTLDSVADTIENRINLYRNE